MQPPNSRHGYPLARPQVHELRPSRWVCWTVSEWSLPHGATDLGDLSRVERLNWSKLPPVPSLDGARLEIRVYNAFDVKDLLKDQGYQFVHDGKYWRRTVPEEGFLIESLHSQRWMNDGVRIEITGEDGEVRS